MKREAIGVSGSLEEGFDELGEQVTDVEAELASLKKSMEEVKANLKEVLELLSKK